MVCFTAERWSQTLGGNVPPSSIGSKNSCSHAALAFGYLDTRVLVCGLVRRHLSGNCKRFLQLGLQAATTRSFQRHQVRGVSSRRSCAAYGLPLVFQPSAGTITTAATCVQALSLDTGSR